MVKEQASICEKIRRLGYKQDNQIRLYGEIFELVSDPFTVGDIVFVDAREQKSGRLRRIRIPLNIVRMANQNPVAA